MLLPTDQCFTSASHLLHIAVRIVSSGVVATAEHYINSGADRVITFDAGTGQLRHRYLHGPVTDQVLFDEVFDDLGQQVELLAPVTDHLQSTRAVLDESGTVVQTIDYDSFGVINDLRDANGNTIEFVVLGGESGLDLSQLATTFAFAGRVWDNDAVLYYNRARWYEPESGRFISVDPIEDGAN